MAQVPWSLELKDLLTKMDRFGEKYALYDYTTGPYAQVPRRLVSHMTPEFDYRVTRAPLPQLIALKGPRMAEQAKVINDSVTLFKKGIDHVVEAPTGFGKTYVGCSVANELRQPTLVIVTKNDLVKGWRDTAQHLIGVPPDQIGHVQQDTEKWVGCRIVTAMIHTLVERQYDPQFYDNFGLVIFDECHRLGAEYFVNACKLFPAAHRLGLSATTDRSDGKWDMVEAHIGPVMVKGTWVPMKPKILVKKTGVKLPMASKKTADGWVKAPMEVVPGRMAPVTKFLAEHVARNREIAEFTKAAYDADRHVLILSDLIDGHLRKLFHYLIEVGIPAEEIGYYIGGMKEHELAVTKKKRVVLATYMMVGEGTDVPHWDSLCMATPRSNIRQAVGRVLRLLPDKKQPVVLDLVDDNGVLMNFHYSRLKQYYGIGAEVVNLD